MDTRDLVNQSRRTFISLGLRGEALTKLISQIRERHTVALAAHLAFYQGIPFEEWPVWFGDESWKTDLWKKQWLWLKAYEEGEDTRSRFGGRDENPYHKDGLPFSSEMLELELVWNMGFDGKVIN